MLYPQSNRYRELFDLSGVWDFAVDPSDEGEKEGWSKGLIENTLLSIAVPGSWNEQFTTDDFDGLDIHNYTGTVWC